MDRNLLRRLFGSASVMAALLMSSLASAAPNLDEIVAGFSDRTIKAVCTSPHLFIGTIDKVNAKLVERSPGFTMPFSTLRFAVERDLRDSVGDSYKLTVPGGTAGGRTVLAGSDYPRPIMGTRYLLAVVESPVDTSSVPKGTPLVYATVWISSKLELPVVGTLRKALEKACA